MKRNRAVDSQGEALRRILVALVAMAGLLAASRLVLPRDIHRAVLRPLRAAQEAARRLPDLDSGPITVAAMEIERLMARFAALCRAIARLIGRVSGFAPNPIRTLRQDGGQPLADMRFRALPLPFPDTS